MKKLLILFMAAILIGSLLCGCSKDSGTNSGNVGNSGNSTPGVQQGTNGGSASTGDGSLRLLSNRYGKSACNTENGYYYLTEGITELRDGSYGMHLMYMDFASGRELYLCSTAGCKHDSLDCPSVFSYDDFNLFSTIPFVFGNNLYILNREADNSNSMSQNVIHIGGGGESQPAVLYRANLDGTGREKIYTFDSSLTIEDEIIGSDQGVYLITKKLSSDKNGAQSYATSSERKLMFLNLSSLSLTEICSMDFGDSISWNIIGCCQNGFVLSGTDFGRALSQDEMWDDDVYRDLYNNSNEVYALLSRDGGKPNEIIRLSNKYEISERVLGDKLYLSSKENQNIEEVDIKTGEKKTICSLPQNCIMDTLGDILCCRDWNLAENPVWYFVDTKTGEVTHSPLTIPCNGWAIDFRGETAQDVLFVYDYDATGSKDGSYEIHQYKHALISKSDLFAGKENYRKIEMVGSGQ